MPSEAGLALQVFNSESPLEFNQGTYYNLAVEALVLPTDSSAQLHLRRSTAGEYTVSLDVDGNVNLSRAGIVLDSATVNPLAADEWYHLHVSAIGEALRVTINDIEVIAVRDAMPLPPGTVAISGTFDDLADDVTPVPPMQTLQVGSVKNCV